MQQDETSNSSRRSSSGESKIPKFWSYGDLLTHVGMDELPAAGAPAATPAAATVQESPIVADGSPQSNDKNAGNRAERDRALDEIHAGITELSKVCTTEDLIKRELERLITKGSKSDDDDEGEIDEDVRNRAKQRLADIDRAIEEERSRWLAEQKTAPIVMEGESQHPKDNENGKEQL